MKCLLLQKIEEEGGERRGLHYFLESLTFKSMKCLLLQKIEEEGGERRDLHYFSLITNLQVYEVPPTTGT